MNNIIDSFSNFQVHPSSRHAHRPRRGSPRPPTTTDAADDDAGGHHAAAGDKAEHEVLLTQICPRPIYILYRVQKVVSVNS